MEVNRVVMIRYEDDQGVRRVGSGLRVGSNKVLTAAHLTDGTRHSVMMGSKEVPATILIRSPTLQ